MKIRNICLCLLLCAAVFTTSLPLRANAWVPDVRVPCGTNVEAQNYNGYNWSKPVLSYLVKTADGIMRVQADASQGYYYVEYYDGAYKLQRALAVEAELPLFGAFYATESNYYILSGQNNPKESPTVECFRVTKYDTDWNRLSSAGVYDCNTTIPFRAGSARMSHSGNKLFIRTCHQMYTASDGLNHQANVTIEVDTASMRITEAFTAVAFPGGYASHSFNQFIKFDGDRVVAVDHGDAYPRSIALTVFPVTNGNVNWVNYQRTDLVSFEGTIGANYTGAAVGGLEISPSSYLVAYSYTSLSNDVLYDAWNIYVTSMDKASGKVTTRQFTHLKREDDPVTTPHLVKIAEDAFVLLWSQKQNVYYVQLNGKGEAVGEIHCMSSASLSDCAPIVVNGKLMWYTYSNSKISFFEIDTANLSESSRIPSYAVGDINSNGSIDAGDYMLLKRYCLGTFTLSPEQKASADVNGDKLINATDYMLVKRHVLGTYKIG